ncbi:unnamed protein product [Phytomonas sp. Hart1]|nr:unnamed protein product [Phytomonas sp. Hart1]|eukprot:CCW68497.1 unnamed protein product [Phytomonas sp. isolate Hart1]
MILMVSWVCILMYFMYVYLCEVSLFPFSLKVLKKGCVLICTSYNLSTGYKIIYMSFHYKNRTPTLPMAVFYLSDLFVYLFIYA